MSPDILTKIAQHLYTDGRHPDQLVFEGDFASVKSTVKVYAHYPAGLYKVIKATWIFYFFKLPTHHGYEFILSHWEHHQELLTLQ